MGFAAGLLLDVEVDSVFFVGVDSFAPAGLPDPVELESPEVLFAVLDAELSDFLEAESEPEEPESEPERESVR